MDLIRTLLLKRKLLRDCREYSYRQLLDEGEVKNLLSRSTDDFSPLTASEIVAGCVRLTAVLYVSVGKIRLGFDLYVKDTPTSDEWILYENLRVTGDTRELTMLRILDDAVTDRELSYTECSFTRLSGTKVNVEQK